MNHPTFFIGTDKTDILHVITGEKSHIASRLSEHFQELSPTGTEDGAKEKHLPTVTVSGSTVSVEVGSIPHPMAQEHSIEWIYLETKQGSQIKFLSPDQPPRAMFSLTGGDQPVAAYAYCNLHGFWRTEI